MRAAIYIRVSTRKKIPGSQDFLQNPEVQSDPLKILCVSRGWEIVRVYSDRGSGADANRPAFRDLMRDATRGEFQAVIVWRFDRCARSATDLLNTLRTFQELGIVFVSHQEAIDTSTALGKMMFTFIAAFSQFERDIMQDRILAGLDYARSHGTKSGKSIGRQKVIFRVDQAIDLKKQGLSWREVRTQLSKQGIKVGLGTLYARCSEKLPRNAS